MTVPERAPSPEERRLLRATGALLAVLVPLGACRSPERVEGFDVYEPDHAEVASGPIVKKSRLQVYWLFEPQVNRVDTQGVFAIGQDPYDVQLVPSYWSREFLRLSNPAAGYYDDFFMHYFEYAHALAQAYPVGDRRAEQMLLDLEKQFRFFCARKGEDVEAEFDEFRADQEAILLN